MATTTSEACKTSELLLQQSNTASNTCAILNSNTDFNCTNCDIKFDSESSLRVHLQYHGESFLGQSTSAGSPWLSSSTTNTSLSSVLPTSSSFTDTGLSPPPSSNNSNVDETQVHTQLKPLHINNNIPTIHPNTSASAGGVLTNTPTPPSSAEAISPSSVSSAATMISYEALPSAIGPSHHHHQLQHQQQHQQQQSQSMTPQQHQLHMGQQAAGMLHPATMQSMHQMQQQYPPQQPQQPQQQQQSQQQQQQQPTQPPHAQQGNSENSNLEYELDASSSAEEIWDLDSNTVKRYNNASGDTSASSTGHGSMESPMGSYGSDLGHPGTGAAASTHHYVPTNAMWGAGSAPPMYPQHHPQQHGFPSTAASHDLYASNDWLHAGSGSLKRPSSTQSDDAKRTKTYQCEACDKWFTSSGHLKRHFNTTLHKNATRHQHKSGSPRIGTPASMMGDLSDSQQGPGSNSISNLNTTTSTLNSSPSPSSPVIGPGGPLGGPPGVPSSNNNVPNSPRASFYSSRTSPAMSNPSPVKMPAAVTGPGGMLTGAVAGTGLPNSNQLRPLPSMKESLSHINNSNSEMDPTQKPDWSMQAAVIQRGGGVGAGGFSNLYSPDSVSAVNRSSYSTDTSSSISMTASVASDYSSNDLYNLQPPQNFSYHGHYNTASMEYSHTNGGGGGGNNTNLYMMYNQGMQPQQPPQPQQQQRVYHHTSDMSNYAPHSEAGSVKDELDQLSVATEDLDEGLSGTGTPATPTDSLEGPPTPVRVSGNGSSTVSNPQAGPTGEYRCSECNKVFNRLCYLKQHNKSFHNGEKPFKCGQCGKRFPVEVLYQEHLAKHAGDKPYKCEVCPKQFNHKTDLRRHMCLHTGEKPFACEVCGKGFIREDRMVKHSDTHKKKQPILMT